MGYKGGHRAPSTKKSWVPCGIFFIAAIAIAASLGAIALVRVLPS